MSYLGSTRKVKKKKRWPLGYNLNSFAWHISPFSVLPQFSCSLLHRAQHKKIFLKSHARKLSLTLSRSGPLSVSCHWPRCSLRGPSFLQQTSSCFFFLWLGFSVALPRPGCLFTSSVGSPLGFLVFQGGIDPFGMWFACWRVLWPSLENDCEVNICLYLWYLAWGLVHKRTQGCRKTRVRTGNCTLLTYGCVCTRSSLLGSLILLCIYHLGPVPLMPNTDHKVHNDTVPGGIDGTWQWNSTCFFCHAPGALWH